MVVGIIPCSVYIQASSSTSASRSKLINHFVGMGFSEKLVSKAIEENGSSSIILSVKDIFGTLMLNLPDYHMMLVI